MNLFYRVLRAMARLTLQIYFKNISFSGWDRLKEDGPRIITANHPSSFLDACVLACFLPGPLYFLVRGDVFHPWFRSFFRWTYQIPIYRFRDGFGNMRRNAETFQKVHEILSQGKTIVIFAEGLTEYEKKLRPIQKGAARMAVGFQKEFPQKSIHLQAIGINYEDIYRFRSAVQVHIGPVFQPDISADPKEDIQLLTEEVARQLSNLVVHIEENRREAIYDSMARKEGVFSLHAQEARRAQFAWAERINNMSKAEVSSLLSQTAPLEPVDSENHNERDSLISKLRCFGFQILYLLMFPFFYLPARVSQYVARKYFVHPSFQQSIAIGLGMFVYLFWILLLALVFYFAFDSIWVGGGLFSGFLICGRYFAGHIWVWRNRRCD